MGMCFFMWCKGKWVGEDQFGNVYYEGLMLIYGLQKCWVIYKGYVEVFVILLGWYGWMYYCIDVLLIKQDYKVYEWQKLYYVNLIGMVVVYCLQGLFVEVGQCLCVIGDYDVWIFGN